MRNDRFDNFNSERDIPVQCESAGGPDADRRANPLIRLKPAGANFWSRFTARAAVLRRDTARAIAMAPLIRNLRDRGKSINRSPKN